MNEQISLLEHAMGAKAYLDDSFTSCPPYRHLLLDMLFMITFFLEISSFSNTCDRMLSPDKKPSLTILRSSNISDIIDCLPQLAKTELPNAEAVFIWQSIVEYFDGHPNVPESVLMTLGWVTPAILANEYAKLTLGNIDVIRNFGLNYNLGKDQLTAIAERVREDFAGKHPEDYTCYDLIALRNILCAFNASEIGMIHASAYRKAAIDIGKLKCGPEVMSAFANLALHRNAFGPHQNWGDGVVKAIGEVAKYLPKNMIDKIQARNNTVVYN